MPLLEPKDSHQLAMGGWSGTSGDVSLRDGCVERKMVESKYLQNCPGRRITLWGYEGQKEDRWVEIRLESRFPLPESAFWQIRLPEEPPPLEERVLPSQCLDRSWGHRGSLLERPASG